MTREQIDKLVFEGQIGDTLENTIKKAGSGDSIASLWVGRMYEVGINCEANVDEAIRWYDRCTHDEGQMAYVEVCYKRSGFNEKIKHIVFSNEISPEKYNKIYWYRALMLAFDSEEGSDITHREDAALNLYYYAKSKKSYKVYEDFWKYKINDYGELHFRKEFVFDELIKITKDDIAKKSIPEDDKKEYEKGVKRLEEISSKGKQEIEDLIKKDEEIFKNNERLIAYHECGHAFMSWYFNEKIKLVKINNLSEFKKEGEYGFTEGVWDYEDKLLVKNKTNEWLNKQICIGLAGRIAEEVFWHVSTTGCEKDLHDVFDLANCLVAYGMSDISKIDPYLFIERFKTNQLDMEIFKEINKIIDTNYDKVKNILENNKTKMQLLVKALLESPSQSLTGEKVKNLLGLTIT